MTAIKFFIPGKPVPQGSKRHVGHGVMVESAKDLPAWRDRVAWFAQLARDASRGGPPPFPTAGGTVTNAPAELTAAFVLPRPKTTPKTRTPPAVKRPDLDKLARAILDAITGILIADDSQVTALHATKRLAEIGESPGAEITLDYRP